MCQRHTLHVEISLVRVEISVVFKVVHFNIGNQNRRAARILLELRLLVKPTLLDFCH
jgi:hypothetical protein